MLEKQIISEVLAIAMSTGGDFAELYVEDRFNLGINMVKGVVENTLSGRDYGVGLRIIHGLNAVYTYMSGFDVATLKTLARKAAATISGVPKSAALDLVETPFVNHHEVKIVPQSVATARKVQLMREGSDAAFAASNEISQVVVNYLDYRQNILIANTEGLFKTDERVRTRYSISTVATRGGLMQEGRDSFGRGMGFEMFDEIDVRAIGAEAARTSLVMLDAKAAPSGRFPAVLDNAFGGVIFHEACGHGLEASAVAKGHSVYTGKLGQQIASPLVNAVDDGTIPNGWGSLNIDDEGNPTSRNLLIENGVLKGYMVDRLNGMRMNMAPTGSTRRQSYKFAPTSRMTNTYILNGNMPKAELFAGVEKGLYAAKLGGGSVNPATGEFNFAVLEGYMIENGTVTHPVKGATLIGTGLEVLQKIDAVSDNFASGEGMCGASSGSIPAGLGQPALRVSEITVGGQES
ncbi:MAG: TldD/PmbA family protein [Bacillota bacterium]|nr:TldD/PmbA family protein [Bacillota bacterium]